MRLLRGHFLTFYALLAFAYLLLPIAVVVLFSFNDPAGRFNYTWEGFTLDHWLDPFGPPGLREAITTSIEIAALASLVATALGTLVALAHVRYGFRGRGLANLLIFMPMTTPETRLIRWIPLDVTRVRSVPSTIVRTTHQGAEPSSTRAPRAPRCRSRRS